MASFIDEILDATDEQESPKSYIYWGCLSAISAIVKKNVSIDRYNAGMLYANTYVLCIGPPGIKKTLGIEICEKLVTEVNNTRVIAGRGSIQAIITELASTKTKEGGGPPPLGASALLSAQEFCTFLVNDDSALPLLIDLYDPRDVWKNRLKGTGVETLNNTYLTMLAASNQELLDTVLTSAVAMGGFISRTIVVIEDQPHNLNALVRPPKKLIDYKSAVKRLREITQLKGIMSFAVGAASYFEEWYMDFRQRSLAIDDRHGIGRRMDVQVLKVSMLMSLAESNDLLLHKRHIQAAIERCMKHGAEAHRIAQTQGRQPLAAQSAWILEDLAKKPDHQMTRQQILKKYTRDMNHLDLDNIIEHLYQANVLTVHSQGRDTVYRMSEIQAEAYLQFLSRRWEVKKDEIH